MVYDKKKFFRIALKTGRLRYQKIIIKRRWSYQSDSFNQLNLKSQNIPDKLFEKFTNPAPNIDSPRHRQQ